MRKTLDATLQTLQDMLTVEDFDVSDAFQHSRSTESLRAAADAYMSKGSLAKRRANQQETEVFYFTVSLTCPAGAGASSVSEGGRRAFPGGRALPVQCLPCPSVEAATLVTAALERGSRPLPASQRGTTLW